MTDDTLPATILIVEDEQALADLYAKFLEPMYTVYTVYNGTEALDSMSDEVDVVLLDRRMPGLSGEEVLEAIRDEGYACQVAMVTAVTPDIDIIEMGFDDYLTKPVDRSELLETVESLLELHAYNDLIKEYYRVISKKTALEVEKTGIEFSDYEEFSQLTEQLTELEAELQEKEETPSEFNVRSLLGRSEPSSKNE